MSKTLIIFLAMAAGSLIALQAAVNSILGQKLAHPLQAAFVSFVGGTLALLLILLVFKIGFPGFTELKSLPPILYIGGILGAIFVSSIIFFAPQIGIANTLTAALAGQLVLGLILDHFGAFGLNPQPINIYKIAGIAMVIAGLVVMNKR